MVKQQNKDNSKGGINQGENGCPRNPSVTGGEDRHTMSGFSKSYYIFLDV